MSKRQPETISLLELSRLTGLDRRTLRDRAKADGITITYKMAESNRGSQKSAFIPKSWADQQQARGRVKDATRKANSQPPASIKIKPAEPAKVTGLAAERMAKKIMRYRKLDDTAYQLKGKLWRLNQQIEKVNEEMQSLATELGYE